MDENLRVLVVDDSLLYRKIVREALNGIPGVTVVGSAENGKRAIEKIGELRPDLVTLDFEMPQLDGLGVLRWMKQADVATRAVMLSSVTQEGAAQTLQALQEGALDFVAKPCGSDARTNLAELTSALTQHARTLRFISHRARAPRELVAAATRRNSSRPAAPATCRETISRRIDHSAPVNIVGIGVSTGGPDALRVMLPQLPANLQVPVVIVQHMPPVFTKSLADSLDRICPLHVQEARDGQLVRAGEVLIAPGGRQMKVVKRGDDAVIRLTDDAPVQGCRPSVDYLFDSLSKSYGAGAIGVIMTGMGYDGTEGCRRIVRAGGQVVAQDEASCVVYGMPRKPIEEGLADPVAPLDRIGHEINRLVTRRTR